MTASLSAHPRRSPASLKSGREMPVLFHLLDVGRAKPAAKTLSSATDEPLSEPAARPAAAESPAVVPVAAEPLAVTLVPAEPAAPVVCETAAPPAPPAAIEKPAPSLAYSLAKREFKPLILPDPPSNLASSLPPEPESPASHSPAVAACIAEHKAETALPEPVAEPASELSADQPAAQPAELTPRSQAKTTAKSNWFATHGRYIAIVFFIGLLGTIYLARTNRRPVPALADHKHSHPGEAGRQRAAADSSDATVVGEAKAPRSDAKRAAPTEEQSPAQLATALEPQTDLHPPSIPQLAEQNAPEATETKTGSPAADANLFPWVKPEERVATRPEPPSSPAPASTPPVNAGSSSVPDLGPQYPVTTPVPQYPTTNTPGPYPTELPFEPANQAAPAYGPASGPVNGPALAPPTGNGPQAYPQDNSARGPRYERTGSGLY